MSANGHVLDDLAAYALGALDPDERNAVQAHIEDCPGCRAALDDYRRLTAVLAETRPGVEAPPAVWAAISARLTTPQPAMASPAAMLTAEPNPPTPIGQASPAFRNPRLLFIGWAATAAALAVVAAFVGWQAFGGTDAGVATLASATDGSVIPLAGQGSAGNPMSGRLYISEDGKEGGLAVIGLPVLQPGATYEIWFVRHDQSRAPGGLFVADSRGSALVKVDIPGPLDQFEGVGITREPAGGSATPTGHDLLAGPVYEK